MEGVNDGSLGLMENDNLTSCIVAIVLFMSHSCVPT